MYYVFSNPLITGTVVEMVVYHHKRNPSLGYTFALLEHTPKLPFLTQPPEL